MTKELTLVLFGMTLLGMTAAGVDTAEAGSAPVCWCKDGPKSPLSPFSKACPSAGCAAYCNNATGYSGGAACK